MAKRKDTFSQREIGSTLNNAVIRALKPTRIPEISDARLRDLRAYSQAVVEPTLAHVTEGFLEYEELVGILVSAALFVQLKYVMQTDKMPAASRAKTLMEKKNED